MRSCEGPPNNKLGRYGASMSVILTRGIQNQESLARILMTEKQNPRNSNARPSATWVVLILLALVGYQVYSGVALKKVGVPGVFEIDFADRPAPPIPAPPEASRNYMLGRWQVEQAFDQVSGGTVIDYQADGTLIGTMTQFVGGSGQKQHTRGRWEFKRLSKDKFQLAIQLENQSTWLGTFKILDQNRVHNIDQNYIAVRVE